MASAVKGAGRLRDSSGATAADSDSLLDEDPDAVPREADFRLAAAGDRSSAIDELESVSVPTSCRVAASPSQKSLASAADGLGDSDTGDETSTAGPRGSRWIGTGSGWIGTGSG
jgi:hypothetical protein